MADTTVVAGKVTVDTSQATASVKDLKDNVKQLQKEFENTKGGTDAQAAAFAKLKAAQQELSKSTNELKEGSKELSDHFQTIKQNAGALGGPLNAASEGVTKLSETFKVLLLNPVVLTITLIVAAVGFLYKAFTNTAEGGEKMEQTFAGIKAAAGAVLDAIFKLGGAIIKFFEGDFSGAFADAKSAITGVVDAAVGAYNAVSKLTAQAQQLRKEQAANDIDQAKRAKDLAVLREQATDPEVEVSKRKAALLVLQKAAQDDAVKDLDLAKRVADNKIALLSIGTDAAKKNYAEISKIRVEQLQGETDSANELRRIGKQITTANKEEQAQRVADAKAAAEKAKQDREQLEAFNTQLTKLRQQNALAGIVDQYAKEQQLLENKIQDEQNSIQKQFNDKKITRAQFDQLEIEQQKSADAQRQALTDKHNADVAANETKFQNELADLRQKITLDGITNADEKEQVQLDINREKALQKALVDYKNDAQKLFQVQQLINDDFDHQQQAADEKRKAARDKKAFEDSKKQLQNVVNDPTTSLKAKQEAIDAEQTQTELAFQNKVITEQQYNDEVAKLAQDRIIIKKKEQEEEKQLASATVDLLGSLAQALGEQTAAGKAFAIAAATIKALQTEITIIAGLSEVGPFGFVAGLVAAAAVGVGLFNTIKQIEAVPVPGESSGSSSAIPSPISVPAPLAPTQASTQLPQSQINQIGQANSSVRAYVVESDNAEAAARAARLQGGSVLGGH